MADRADLSRPPGPLLLNAYAGFRAVPETLRMTGLKVGWAFAWRTLIAAELLFEHMVFDAVERATARR